MELRRQFLTENDCYRAGRRIRPWGVMVHSTGADNPNVSRYVPGDDVIGHNREGNHWDQSNEEWRRRFGGPLDKCVHAFVGRFAGGEVGAVQTLPWTMRGWHAGRGDAGSANDTHISFEICEDGLEDPVYFQAIYRQAAELTAYLCGLYGLDPLAEGAVICHAEGHRLGIASEHIDVLHWFPKFGKTMDDFRADVARKIEEEDTVTQQQFDDMMADWLERQGQQPADGWAEEIIRRAEALGITDGTRPKALATRQEVMAMAAAAARRE